MRDVPVVDAVFGKPVRHANIFVEIKARFGPKSLGREPVSEHKARGHPLKARARDLPAESRTVFEAAAVFALSWVGHRGQKLREQVAMGPGDSTPPKPARAARSAACAKSSITCSICATLNALGRTKPGTLG